MYLVTATDADLDNLTFSITGQTAGLSITQLSATTARVVWADPDPGAIRAFEVVVTDARGLSGRQGVNLRVGVAGTPGNPDGPTEGPTVDLPPVITSTPSFAVVEGQSYRYRVVADDPDATAAAPIVYGLDVAEEVRAWLSIDTATGLLQGTPPAGIAGTDGGTPRIVVTATQNGAEALQGYTLQITSADSNVNNAPVIEPAEGLVAFAGSSFGFQVDARDPEGDPLTFSLLDAAGDAYTSLNGVSIDARGRIAWDVPATAATPGLRSLTVVARDSKGAVSAPQTFAVDLRGLDQDAAPTVSLRASSNRIEAGQQVLFAVEATDDIGIADRYLTITSPGLDAPVRVNVGNNGLARYTPATALAGQTLTVVATAVDTGGKTATAGPLEVRVAAANLNAPQLRVANVYPGQLIESDTDVVGTIYDADANLVYYALTLKNAEGTVLKRTEVGVFGGDGDDVIDNLGSGTVDEVLFGINPLALANGSYTLELLAKDTAGSIASAKLPVTVQVDNEVKLGNFALSFTDLSIAVGGIPLTATRSYDTLDSDRSLDFGHGWQLDIATGGLKVVDPYSTSLSNEFTDFGEGLRANSRIEVELPGGEKLGFTITPIAYDKGTDAGGILGLAGFAAFGFQPDREDIGHLLEFEFGEKFKLDDTNREAWGVDDILRDRGDGFLRTISGILDTSTGGLNAPLAGAANAGDLGIPTDATIWGAFRVTTLEGTKYRFDRAAASYSASRTPRATGSPTARTSSAPTPPARRPPAWTSPATGAAASPASPTPPAAWPAPRSATATTRSATSPASPTARAA